MYKKIIYSLKNKWPWMSKKKHRAMIQTQKNAHKHEINRQKEKYEEQLKALPEILDNLELVQIRIAQETPQVYKLITHFDPYAMKAIFCHGYNDDPYFEYLADYIAHRVVNELKRCNITRDFKCERG